MFPLILHLGYKISIYHNGAWSLMGTVRCCCDTNNIIPRPHIGHLMNRPGYKVGQYHYPYFTERETEVQREGEASCPKSVTELGTQPRSPESQSTVLSPKPQWYFGIARMVLFESMVFRSTVFNIAKKTEMALKSQICIWILSPPTFSLPFVITVAPRGSVTLC